MNPVADAVLHRRYNIFILFIVVAFMGLGNLLYTNYAIGRSDQSWCDALGTFDRPIVSKDTEGARRAIKALHHKRVENGCIDK